MIAYDIDPSLDAAEPEYEMLDDGFSAPRDRAAVAPQPPARHVPLSLERALAAKSDF